MRKRFILHFRCLNPLQPGVAYIYPWKPLAFLMFLARTGCNGLNKVFAVWWNGNVGVLLKARVTLKHQCFRLTFPEGTGIFYPEVTNFAVLIVPIANRKNRSFINLKCLKIWSPYLYVKFNIDNIGYSWKVVLLRMLVVLSRYS